MLKLSSSGPIRPSSSLKTFVIWFILLFVLGEILLPFGGHYWIARHSQLDERGFPNPRGVKQADLIVLGDSQGSGSCWDKKNAWPLKLGSLLGKPVYTVSRPYLSLVDSYEQLNTVLAFKPKTIFVNLDLGSDFLKVFETVYVEKRMDRFRDQDPNRIRQWTELENRFPLSKKVRDIQSLMTEQEGIYRGNISSSKGFCGGMRRLLSYSACYRFGLFLKHKLNGTENRHAAFLESKWDTIKAAAQKVEGVAEVVDDPRLHMIFWPEYRALALGREDPRIIEGMRITLEILRDIQDRLQKEAVKFVPVLIPTKESAYAQFLSESDLAISEKFKNLIENENYFRSRTIDFLRAARIGYVDVLPAVQKALKAGTPVYRVIHDDDCPVRTGHAVFADAVAEGLKEMESLDREKSIEKTGWEYRSFPDRNKDFELKALVGTAALAFLVIFIFTRTRQEARPKWILCLYGMYLLFQMIYRIEFFPLTAFQMFSFVEEKTVLYDKMVVILQDGKEVKIPDHQVLPILADGRSKRYVEEALKSPELANEFTTIYDKAYDRRFRKSGDPGIAEIHFERWKWNAFDDPRDPNRGFVIQRAIGKPYEESSDV
ncbi:MAG: hypothetical protein EXS63_00700 [Candidatus Omnitrophica bacterium]|nr:hypothetical protein [Candidatus Omnitrophota bacterium]